MGALDRYKLLLLICIKSVKMRFNLLCVCVHQVAGIKGMLIANKRQDNQVKTYITYNKGRDWRLLQAPATDLDGNDIHCILVRYGIFIIALKIMCLCIEMLCEIVCRKIAYRINK